MEALLGGGHMLAKLSRSVTSVGHEGSTGRVRWTADPSREGAMNIDDGEASTQDSAVAATDTAVENGHAPVADGSADSSEGDSLAADTPAGPETDDRATRSARAAAIVFGIYVVVAFPILLYLGRDYWFRGDDWGLLAGRSLQLDDLFQPQNQHWSTVPILSYRALYSTFGLRSYMPYMAVVIMLHLAVAILARVVMRRAGVGPWVATVVAGTYVLFGPGNENYFLSIQVSMMGSMVCGFAHLLLADHDGPFDKRDALGLAFGVVGLMSSGIAPPLVVIVGLAVLLRRGWLMAFLHTAPLGLIYGVWYVVHREELQAGSGGLTSTSPPLGVIFDWIRDGMSEVFNVLGGFPGVAIALAAMLVVGLYLAWKPLAWSEWRRLASMPAALLLGAPLLFGLLASQRWHTGFVDVGAPRYLDMATAMALPALAVAANAFVQRWKPLGLLVLVLFVIGVPSNVTSFDRRTWNSAVFKGEHDFVLGVAYSELLDEVRRDVYPNPHQFLTDAVTVGFLRDARDDGRLPEEPELGALVLANVTNRLRVSQSPPEGDSSAGFECETHSEPLELRPNKGDQFGIRGGVQISTSKGESRTLPTPYGPTWSGDLLTVEVPDLTLYVSAAPSATTFRWCAPP